MSSKIITLTVNQPPSGGCVLKPFFSISVVSPVGPAASRRLCVETCLYSLKPSAYKNQPPSGGCVLKRCWSFWFACFAAQPPSGGCVLKRLSASQDTVLSNQPPSGGCVLKLPSLPHGIPIAIPAAFRRLCVETGRQKPIARHRETSRLQAAVC